MIATEIMPTTPSLPNSLTSPTRLSIIFDPRNGEEGPKSTSKIIAIAMRSKPKSTISLIICLILDIMQPPLENTPSLLRGGIR